MTGTLTEPGGGILSARFRVTTVGIVGLTSLVAFEAMAVATALPTAVRELDGLAWYGWSFTALLVASVLGMVASGQLADRIGARRPLLLGVGFFLAGLVLAGTAQTMALFIAGRALQGFGAGLLVVVLYVLVGEAYPERLRPAVFGGISAAWVVPALVGPVVSGWLAAGPGWRWVFLALIPLVVTGAVLLVPTSRRLRPPADPAPLQPRRWVAAVSAAAGVAAVQWAAQQATAPAAVAGVAGLGLIALGLRELLPGGTVRLRRGVPVVVALRGLLAGAFFAVESLVPLTLQDVHGYSPTAAGVPLTGGALGWAAASWFQGRRADVPRERFVRTGAILVAVAAGGMAVVSQGGSPAWLVYAVWPVGGLGMGLAMSSIGVLLLAQTPPAERGRNSSALQLADSVCSALLIGGAGALVAASTRGVLGLSAAAGLVDLAMLGVVVLAAVVAGRARDPAAVR